MSFTDNLLFMNRLEFIAALTGLPLLPALAPPGPAAAGRPPGPVPDEAFWEQVHQDFYLDDTRLDLRSFAASPLPRATLQQAERTYRHVQQLPSLRGYEPAAGSQEELRVKIARELSCSPGEVALMRSTTEALNNALLGCRLKPGDEVLASVHEYDSMVGSLRQRQQREGIVVRPVAVPYQPASPEQVLACFQRQVSPRTKLILLSHIVWISGQIYPVREVCQWARARGIATVVDAAQSFSHVPVDVEQLGCDYLGAPLHKWCAGPLGTGFLYVRRERIAQTYPLAAHFEYAPDADRIEKFENFGALAPVFQAGCVSLAYWHALGLEAKRARMQFLKEYWMDKLRALPQVRIVTNQAAADSCGIGFFTVKNRSATELKAQLLQRHGIVVQAVEHYKNINVDYQGVNAIGIATPVFVLPTHLDRFAASLAALLKA